MSYTAACPSLPGRAPVLPGSPGLPTETRYTSMPVVDDKPTISCGYGQTLDPPTLERECLQGDEQKFTMWGSVQVGGERLVVRLDVHHAVFPRHERLARHPLDRRMSHACRHAGLHTCNTHFQAASFDGLLQLDTLDPCPIPQGPVSRLTRLRVLSPQRSVFRLIRLHAPSHKGPVSRLTRPHDQFRKRHVSCLTSPVLYRALYYKAPMCGLIRPHIELLQCHISGL